MEVAITRIVSHRHAFADTPQGWWITPAEATRLVGCSRQEIHRLIADGVLASRNVADAAGRQLKRVNGADLVSILNAPPPEAPHDRHPRTTPSRETSR